MNLNKLDELNARLDEVQGGVACVGDFDGDVQAFLLADMVREMREIAEELEKMSTLRQSKTSDRLEPKAVVRAVMRSSNTSKMQKAKEEFAELLIAGGFSGQDLFDLTFDKAFLKKEVEVKPFLGRYIKSLCGDLARADCFVNQIYLKGWLDTDKIERWVASL